MADKDKSASNPATLTPETSLGITMLRQDGLDLASSNTSSTTSTTPRQDHERPSNASDSARCRIDISAMTAAERLEFANTLPITQNMMSTQTAWPASGGVWVLDPTEAQVEELKNYNVTDMEEYCRVLEAVGATFYSDPSQHEGSRIVMEDTRGYEAQIQADAKRKRERRKERSAEEDSAHQPSSE